MPSFSARIVLVCLAILSAPGCVQVEPVAKSLLAKPALPAGSVVLDIFFVRAAMDDPLANDTLWQEIDEQHFSAKRRRRLQQNGFRVGVVGGQIPIPLSELLELSGKPAATADLGGEARAANLASDPRVMRRHLQIRAGVRGEIIASGLHDELPVLLRSDSGGIGGQTYRKAQAVLAVRAFPEPDGRVRLDMTPEVHYGEVCQRIVPGQGTFRLDAGRRRRVFDELGLEATLLPGQMLVLAALPERPGSLGHHFFTESQFGPLEQKLLVVRLSQTQHDDLFD